MKTNDRGKVRAKADRKVVVRGVICMMALAVAATLMLIVSIISHGGYVLAQR